MPSDSPIDTNVLIRFLVETPASIPRKFRGVFAFFDKLEREEATAFLPDLVLFQSFFVLTAHYEVPTAEAAGKLARLIALRGVHMSEKHIAGDCLRRLQDGEPDLVDAWFLAWCADHKRDTVYSFDAGLRKHGLKLLPVR